MPLTDGIFETGAYPVPSKSQDPTILVRGGPSSTQCSNSSWACHWHHRFGTINYPPFQHTIKNQVFIPALDFSVFAKIRFGLEMTNTHMIWFWWQLVRIRMMVSKPLKGGARV